MKHSKLTPEEAKKLGQKISNAYAAIRATATPEVIAMMYENPAQFYNQYIKEPEQKALTDEEYQDLIKQIRKLRGTHPNPFALHWYYPVTPSEAYSPKEPPGFWQMRSQDNLHPRPIAHGDVRIVMLPVQVIFEKTDRVIADYDYDTEEVLEYKDGYVMTVCDGQSFLYQGQETQFLGSAYMPNNHKNPKS